MASEMLTELVQRMRHTPDIGRVSLVELRHDETVLSPS